MELGGFSETVQRALRSSMTRAVAAAACAFLFMIGTYRADAQEQAGVQAVERQANLYAVEIKTGPIWDKAKPANEQPYFREHSANLRKLRDQGSLVLGARYADKGLVVLQATSEQEARSMMDQDASIKNGVFAYEVYDFNVFYGGSVQSKQRRQ